MSTVLSAFTREHIGPTPAIPPLKRTYSVVVVFLGDSGVEEAQARLDSPRLVRFADARHRPSGLDFERIVAGQGEHAALPKPAREALARDVLAAVQEVAPRFIGIGGEIGPHGSDLRNARKKATALLARALVRQVDALEGTVWLRLPEDSPFRTFLQSRSLASEAGARLVLQPEATRPSCDGPLEGVARMGAWLLAEATRGRQLDHLKRIEGLWVGGFPADLEGRPFQPSAPPSRQRPVPPTPEEITEIQRQMLARQENARQARFRQRQFPWEEGTPASSDARGTFGAVAPKPDEDEHGPTTRP